MSGQQLRRIILVGLAIAIGVLLYVEYTRYKTGKQRMEEDARRIQQLLQEQDQRSTDQRPARP